MLVTCKPGLREICFNKDGRYISIKEGEKVELDNALALPFIQSGALVKAEFPGIVNDEVITVEFKDDMSWRPIGKPKARTA